MESEVTPFFSVIIPVYNKAPFVRRAVDSVLHQTFADFELLLIDDASTDGSLPVLQAFSDSRIRILHRDRPGPGGYAARNLGIREARAEWVAFLDADDEWLPEHLEVLRRLVRASGCHLLATGWTDSPGGTGVPKKPFSSDHQLPDVRQLSLTDVVGEAMRGKPPIWTGAVCIQRELILASGGFAESCKRGGDTAAWLKILHQTGRAVCSSNVTAIYHRDASTVTRTTPVDVLENCIYKTCRDLLKNTKDVRTRWSLQRFSNYHVRFGLEHNLRSGNLKPSDCSAHYSRANILDHMLFEALSLLPCNFQKKIPSIFRSVKGLVVPK
jgi:glycosyltransferase involved in cell wall biosynthesis